MNCQRMDSTLSTNMHDLPKHGFDKHKLPKHGFNKHELPKHGFNTFHKIYLAQEATGGLEKQERQSLQLRGVTKQ